MKYLRPAIAIMLLGLLLAACGGGGESNGENEESTGPRELTGPGDVPTVTPIDGDLVFSIRDNNVTSPDGESTTVPDTGSLPQGGGDDDGGDGDSEGEGDNDGGSGSDTYTIQPNDTCFAIAEETGASIDDIISMNPQVNDNCSNLTAGENLRVPGDSSGSDEDDDAGGNESDDGSGGDDEGDNGADDDDATDDADDGGSTGGETYVIQSGDLCTTIADDFGVDMDELISLNNLNCDNLPVDETIQIP